MKTMDASKVRMSFSRLVNAVRNGGDELLITRYGHPIVALVRLDRLTDEEKKLIPPQHPEGVRIRRPAGE